MFLANTRGNSTLCAQATCNFNVINEQGLADKISQAQDDVDSQQNTSAEKRAGILSEGHSLLAIPWLVSLVDSGIEALEKKAHAVLTLEGPDGSPPWPDRDEAADHLQKHYPRLLVS